MRRVSSTDFQQAVGTYSDAAMEKPVVITSHNRDRLVLLNVKEYERLKAIESAVNKDRIDRAIERHSETLTELSKR